MRAASVGLFSLLVICTFLRAGPVPQSNTFSSAKYHFRVQYPESWHPVDHTIQVLNIINFPSAKRVQGVVIPRTGAMITVVPAPAGATSVERWIAKDTVDSKLLGKRDIEVPRQASGCTRLVEARWRFEQGPGAYTYETAYYCSTGAKLFRVELSNWDGNPAQRELQAIALNVALSLRSF